RAARDELIACHHTGLADAVGAVRGLVFHRRIPPRVEMNDCVRAGEREAHAAGLEADEKDGNLRVALEFLHHGAAIGGRAVEVAELNVLRRELVPEQRKHRRELAEDQHAMTPSMASSSNSPNIASLPELSSLNSAFSNLSSRRSQQIWRRRSSAFSTIILLFATPCAPTASMTSFRLTASTCL